MIDLNLTLPPLAVPANVRQAQRADGTPAIPENGFVLAQRLRARGYLGKVILHSGDTLASLQKLASHTAVDAYIEKGSASQFREKFGKIVEDLVALD